MATAELQIVEFVDDGGSKIPVFAQCTLCPYPKIFFDTQGKVGSPEDNEAELRRQFAEHLKQVHVAEDQQAETDSSRHRELKTSTAD